MTKTSLDAHGLKTDLVLVTEQLAHDLLQVMQLQPSATLLALYLGCQWQLVSIWSSGNVGSIGSLLQCGCSPLLPG